MDFCNRSYPDIRANVTIEKPLKHQRRLGLDYIHVSEFPSRYAYVNIYIRVNRRVSYNGSHLILSSG